MNKYELTSQTKEFVGTILHRIRVLVDIPAHGVKAGDVGGWIQCEENLSQKGSAWISDEALVFGNARVYDDAVILEHQRLCIRLSGGVR